MNKTDTTADYPRRVLLAVTGMSPQILTETLYALVTAEEHCFIPTEIHVLTTSDGANRVRTSLLHADGGQFHAFLADYPRAGKPSFDDAHIHLITDVSGKTLPDIRTPEENAAAADAITALVAKFTADPDCALHVSIAGGRKTMGFYLGYAFSLFARPQDRLSHVLVSSPFESLNEFFYPPATPRRLATRDGGHIDTADAVITLAEIPVVRLRHGLPEELQRGKLTFNQAVSAVQMSFDPPELEIDRIQRTVRCGKRFVKLSPAIFAWLIWWAEQVRNGTPMKSWREANPYEFLAIYQQVVGTDANSFEESGKRLKNGMEEAFFQENNAKLEKAIRETLGTVAAVPYLLDRITLRTPQGRHTRRGLTLPPDAIKIRP